MHPSHQPSVTNVISGVSRRNIATFASDKSLFNECSAGRWRTILTSICWGIGTAGSACLLVDVLQVVSLMLKHSRSRQLWKMYRFTFPRAKSLVLMLSLAHTQQDHATSNTTIKGNNRTDTCQRRGSSSFCRWRLVPNASLAAFFESKESKISLCWPLQVGFEGASPGNSWRPLLHCQ